MSQSLTGQLPNINAPAVIHEGFSSFSVDGQLFEAPSLHDSSGLELTAVRFMGARVEQNGIYTALIVDVVFHFKDSPLEASGTIIYQWVSETQHWRIYHQSLTVQQRYIEYIIAQQQHRHHCERNYTGAIAARFSLCDTGDLQSTRETEEAYYRWWSGDDEDDEVSYVDTDALKSDRDRRQQQQAERRNSIRELVSAIDSEARSGFGLVSLEQNPVWEKLKGMVLNYDDAES